MIKEGQRKKAKYWGNLTVSKVAKLEAPISCYSKEKGKVLFSPTIVKIAWETNPSNDKNEFWFPYWETIDGKEKYGQFAPMIGQASLLKLLQEAIKQDFFDRNFLMELMKTIQTKISVE